MTSLQEYFSLRASAIPSHGLGLSVDVYSPDLSTLIDAFERAGMRYGYLEVFKAPETVLAAVRRRLPRTLLEYHGEGIWLTQPDLRAAYPLEAELRLARSHVQALGSHWINHECAAKQMAGYSFGTYLPPVFTRESAAVVARNVQMVQAALDQDAGRLDREGPLLLVEVPPLTYFGFGDLSVAEYFRAVTEAAPCGLVLDVGHLWTVHRYSAIWENRPLERFLSEFLHTFPLDRVVQIHLAGLGPAPAMKTVDPRGVPTLAKQVPDLWVDAHAEPVPDVLFAMLDAILADPGLTNLKGVALEVDTKPIPQILEEFRRLQGRYGCWNSEQGCPLTPRTGGMASCVSGARHGAAELREAREDRDTRSEDLRLYRQYVDAISGKAELSEVLIPSGNVDPTLLDLYRHVYLRHEILHWGGDLRAVFPSTCQRLEGHGRSLDAFVDYWVRAPRVVERPYDYFLLKLERFVEFVSEAMPEAAETAAREAADMRAAYLLATQHAGVLETDS